MPTIESAMIEKPTLLRSLVDVEARPYAEPTKVARAMILRVQQYGQGVYPWTSDSHTLLEKLRRDMSSIVGSGSNDHNLLSFSPARSG